MAYTDFDTIVQKVEGAEGAPGELSAADFNATIEAIKTNRDRLDDNDTTKVKSITVNGGSRKFTVEDGNIDIEIIDSGYALQLLDAKLSRNAASDLKYYIGQGEPLIFTASLSHKYTAPGGESTISPAPCIVTFYCNGVEVHSAVAADSNDEDAPSRKIEFNFGPYIKRSIDNTIQVKVNNGLGESTSSELYLVEILNLVLTSNMYNAKIIKADNLAADWSVTFNVTGDSANIYAFIDGTSLGGYLDEDITKPLKINTTPVEAGDNFTYIVQENIVLGSHAVGSHTFTMYAESAKATGVYTSEQTFMYLYVNEEEATTILDTSFKKDSSQEPYTRLQAPFWVYYMKEPNQMFNGDLLIRSWIEVPQITGSTPQFLSERVISLADSFYKDDNFNILLSDASHKGISTLHFELWDNNSTEGNRIESKEVSFEIKELSEDRKVEEVKGYLAKFSAEGKSNGDPDNLNFEWKSTSGSHIIKFSSDMEFNEYGSGWLKDSDGNTFLRLKRGRKATVEYKPFDEDNNGVVCQPNELANSASLQNYGLTISFILKPHNVTDRKSIVVRCRDRQENTVDEVTTTTYTGAGFDISANSVSLYISESNYVYCDFMENERLQIDLVIEGGHYHYKRYAQPSVTTDPDLFKKKLIESKECYSRIYINGVYQQLLLNPTDTSYRQVNPMEILLGSDECDLDIYEIRIYKKSLNIIDILQNYAYGAPTVEEKVSRMLRNNIFENGSGAITTIRNEDGTVKESYYAMPLFEVNIPKLEAALPELPIWSITAPWLPGQKGGDGRINIYKTAFTNPTKILASEENILDGAVPFTSGIPVNGKYNRMSCQGTSSMGYPMPYRNWDWKLGDSEETQTDENGEEIVVATSAGSLKPNGSSKFKHDLTDGTYREESKYSLYKDMPGIKKITLKKDYASSEMVNNAICSEIFNDMASSISNSFVNVQSPAQRILGKNNPNVYKLALEATPIFMYRQWNMEEDIEGSEEEIESLGMINLIPNKTEVDYLGFTGDFTYEKCKAQSWEIQDNHVFWDIPLGEAQWVNNKVFNPVAQSVDSDAIPSDCKYIYSKGYYEARYPEDSFKNLDTENEKLPFGNAISADQIACANEETAEIRDFHNWVCSCNPETATGDILENPYVDSEQKTHTIDNIAYRHAKFRTEAEDRMILDQWILYYIWREQFWMYDSGSKNLQLYTMGRKRHTSSGNYAKDAVDFYSKKSLKEEAYSEGDQDFTKPYQWGCMVRDADTGLGIDNLGVLKFPPYLEETDLMVSSTSHLPLSDIEFAFDEYPLNGEVTFNDLTAEGKNRSQVLNGQQGAIWRLIAFCYQADIRSMYGSLYTAAADNNNSSNFTFERASKKFNDHQDKWCEALYNFGSQQYYGGDIYTDKRSSGCGNKRHQRDLWLFMGFKYRASKYGADTGNHIVFRGKLSQKDIKVGTYIPMYVSGGGTGAGVAVRHIDNTSGHAIYKYSGNPGDSESFLYGADLITELPNLYELGAFELLTLSNATRLKVLKIGNALETTRDPRSGIDSLNIASRSIEVLDVSDYVSLTIIPSLSEQLYLREFYCIHNSIQNLSLPPSASLRVLHIGSTPDPNSSSEALRNGNPLTSLTCNNLVGLEDVEVLGGAPIMSNLTINNSNHRKLYELTVMTAQNNVVGKKISISNTNWPLAEWYSSATTVTKQLESLAKNSIAFTRTVIDLGNDASFMNYKLKEQLAAKFGDIDSVTNSLHIKYFRHTPYYININIPSKIYLGDAGIVHQLPFSVAEGDFTSYKLKRSSDGVYRPAIKWTLVNGADAQYASLKEDGSLELTEAAVEDGAISIQVKVSIELLTGELISKEITVCLYHHEAKPGDVVYADGGFEEDPSARPGETPIGVCFWAKEGNKGHGLMMNIKSITSYVVNKGLIQPLAYGPEKDLPADIVGLEDSRDSYIVKDLLYSKDLSENFSGDNYTTVGTYLMPGADGYEINPTPSYGGNSLELLYESHFTKALTEAEATILNKGFFKDDTTKYVYSKGQVMSLGKYNTLVTIIHRNIILSSSGFTAETYLKVPAKTSELTELESLMTNIIGNRNLEISDSTKAYYELLLYPYTSACYSFNPQAKLLGEEETIDAKFREGNWYHPCAAELFRIQFLLSEAYNKTIRDLGYTLDEKLAEALSRFEKLLSNKNYLPGLHIGSVDGLNGNNTNILLPASDGNPEYGDYSRCYEVKPIKNPGFTGTSCSSSFRKKHTEAEAEDGGYIIACCEF